MLVSERWKKREGDNKKEYLTERERDSKSEG